MRTPNVALLGATVLLAACDARPPLADEPPVFACTLEARAGVVVVVRDSVTGKGLAKSVSALLRSGSFVESLRFAFDDSLIGGAYERAGTYRVELSAPGYRDWAREGVQVPQGQCHVESARVVALLVPQ